MICLYNVKVCFLTISNERRHLIVLHKTLPLCSVSQLVKVFGKGAFNQHLQAAPKKIYTKLFSLMIPLSNTLLFTFFRCWSHLSSHVYTWHCWLTQFLSSTRGSLPACNTGSSRGGHHRTSKDGCSLRTLAQRRNPGVEEAWNLLVEATGHKEDTWSQLLEEEDLRVGKTGSRTEDILRVEVSSLNPRDWRCSTPGSRLITLSPMTVWGKRCSKISCSSQRTHSSWMSMFTVGWLLELLTFLSFSSKNINLLTITLQNFHWWHFSHQVKVLHREFSSLCRGGGQEYRFLWLQFPLNVKTMLISLSPSPTGRSTPPLN